MSGLRCAHSWRYLPPPLHSAVAGYLVARSLVWATIRRGHVPDVPAFILPGSRKPNLLWRGR